MTTSLPKDPKTPASDINQFLTDWATRDTRVYVHPRVLSFATGQRKMNWGGSLPDADDRDVLANFIRAPKPNPQGGTKQCWLAFASGPVALPDKTGRNGSWVGKPTEEWDNGPWHCFAIAVIRAVRPETGYNLIICDPDPNLKAEQANPRIRDVLRDLQRDLYTQLREKSKNTRVWYRTRRDRDGEGQCLRNAMELLEELVHKGGGQWQGEDDERVEGCVEIILQ